MSTQFMFKKCMVALMSFEIHKLIPWSIILRDNEKKLLLFRHNKYFTEYLLIFLNIVKLY